MREAFISDVHACYMRLLQAEQGLKKAGYDRMRCLGDVVADVLHPSVPWNENETIECIDTITSMCDTWMLGNHDRDAQVKKGTSNNKIIEYLSDAMIMKRENGTVYTHAAPCIRIDEFHSFGVSFTYIDTPARAMMEFLNSRFDIAFIGHTHVPAAFGSDGSAHYFTKSGTIKLDEKLRWILSVGSVGFSRDDNPAISCAIYDHDKREYTVIRGE